MDVVGDGMAGDNVLIHRLSASATPLGPAISRTSTTFESMTLTSDAGCPPRDGVNIPLYNGNCFITPRLVTLVAWVSQKHKCYNAMEIRERAKGIAVSASR
jgi:hypothetical protein